MLCVVDLLNVRAAEPLPNPALCSLCLHICAGPKIYLRYPRGAWQCGAAARTSGAYELSAPSSRLKGTSLTGLVASSGVPNGRFHKLPCSPYHSRLRSEAAKPPLPGTWSVFPEPQMDAKDCFWGVINRGRGSANANNNHLAARCHIENWWREVASDTSIAKGFCVSAF